MTIITWDATAYDRNHGYIWNLAGDLVTLLAPQPGERVLDLGCGTGHLTAKIAASGATAAGIDSDGGMVAQAQANYPNLEFAVADATDFSFAHPFDAVFSSAVLHWIPQAQAGWAVANVHRALKPSGRFVAELGGRDNVRTILAAAAQVLRAAGWHRPDDWTPWYFPSLGEYTTLLEASRFNVTFAQWFERPTPLVGEDGLRHWLEIFRHRLFPELGQRDLQAVIRDIEQVLRPVLYREGGWVADYTRLRFVAVKRGTA